MRYFLPAILVCCSLVSLAQFKNDNVLFKTVSIEDLCAQLKATPNAVLLDVRSKGEYEDTSTFTNLNIGRLKKAIHLDINEMPTRWRELTPYKDRPLYVMCSHSQRSRRVSKMLADSGFTNIINVNGGLSTYNILSSAQALCKDQLYETNNSYKLVSPLDLCNFVSANKDVFVLDVRSDSAYRGIASDERQNAPGKLKAAVNIPMASLSGSLASVPASKKILIVDDFGNESPKAARLLVEKGYKDVHVLFNGMDLLTGRSRAEIPCSGNLVNKLVRYQVMAADEFDALVRKDKNITIVDVRPAEEFTNQSKTAWRNIGQINNAVNIPWAEFEKRSGELGAAKGKPVILYHFSSATDAFKAAKHLSDQGFQKVYVLAGGLFNLRWQAANLKGRSQFKDHVVNVPAENL
ncbi:MAG TPA: rhodanese-like domain-containing protein [Chitinophagaceae bacterium]|nr:rhodanese-like domain-containing protein [Chitinophagaceae bacterium]